MQLYNKRGGRRAKKNAKEDKKVKKSPGALRVQIDLGELDLDELPNCKLEIPNKENLQIFIVKISVDSKDSYWFGGKYSFKFEIPDNYPHKAPKVTCLEKIYHPNIDVNGPICLNLLKNDWSAVLTVQQVVHGLLFLFLEPNGADPLNLSAAKVLRENVNAFKNNVTKSLRGEYVDGTKFPKMV